MTNEIWKPCKNYEGLYEISDKGIVRSLRYGKIKEIKLFKNYKGYWVARLHHFKNPKNIYIHRLIAHAFIPNPEKKPQINHINGVKHDNRIENLEWCTHSENINHAIHSLGKVLWRSGRANTGSKDILQVSLDGFIVGHFDTLRDAAVANGIDPRRMGEHVSGKRKIKECKRYLWL